MASAIHWTTSQITRTTDKAQREAAVDYLVTDQITLIDSGAELLFIDYQDALLYRLDRQQDKCAVFTFDESSRETGIDPSGRRMAALLGEIKVQAKDEERLMHGLKSHRSTALLGAGMFRFRPVAPVIIERYGQSFKEARGEYWATAAVTAWPALQAAVAQRQAAFAAAPLLRRVDPLGIMEQLDGFPLQWREQHGELSIEALVTSGPDPSAARPTLPEQCRESRPRPRQK